MNTIIATEGNTFRRIHDGFIMGEIIHLGIDFSTGTPREDKPEYYEEVPEEKDDERERKLYEGIG